MDPCMKNLHFLFPVFCSGPQFAAAGNEDMLFCACMCMMVCVCVCNVVGVCVVCICVCLCGMVWRYGKEIAGERQSKARCPAVFFLLGANQRQAIGRSMNRHGFCNPYLWQRPRRNKLYASTMSLSYAVTYVE
jgi:hypothetical protein